MGPKKGRPRKNISVDSSDGAGGGSKDTPVMPKAPRGRPAKKKLPIVASTSSTDASLPSIENVPVVRKTSRGRGRKRAQLSRDVLCTSNTREMQLRSQTCSGNLESIADGGKDSQLIQIPSIKSPASINITQDVLNCNSESYPAANPLTGDLSDGSEDKSNKENNFLTNNDTSSSLQKPELRQTKDLQNPNSVLELNALTSLHEESSITSMPFPSGDVPLKKRRLRDLVVRDQEGFLIPTTATTFTSPTSSASSTPQADFQTEVSKRIIGAHVLFSGGYEQAIYKAKSSEYQAMGMFLKDLTTWVEPTDISDEDSMLFKKAVKECGFCCSSIIARGSYIINICSSDDEVLHASSECIIDDLKRCSQLGLTHYTIQLGEFDHNDNRELCSKRVTDTLNFIHKLTSSVITVLENTCGGTNTLGGCVNDLKDIFDNIDDQDRIGFALDTCHLYSSGIDISKRDVFESVIQEFQENIGLQYLKVFYVNDSQGELNSCIDHHLSIGQGKIGLDFFEILMNHPDLHKVPMIIETPLSEHHFDFQTLNNLIH